MKEEEKLNGGSSVELRSLWRPEYASYMVEGTPGGPYGGSTNYFNTVEHNMRLRRRELEDLLEEDEVCVSISAFPRLGCPGFTVPETKPDPENSFMIPFQRSPRGAGTPTRASRASPRSACSGRCS